MRSWIAVVLVTTVGVFAAAGQSSDDLKGSIGGVVVEAGTGKPLHDGKVYYDHHGESVDIGPDGHFKIEKLVAGTHELETFRPAAHKVVQLAAGESLTVELRVTPAAVISGRVLNQNGEPVPEISVSLVSREYRLGALRYVFASVGRTDDQGRYLFPQVPSGRGFFIVAGDRHSLNIASAAPEDMRLRKRVTAQTWYPGSGTVEGAEVLVLQPGERREGMDIKLERSISHCIDGLAGQGSGMGKQTIFLEETAPSSGEWADGRTYMVPPAGQTGDDGKFRICDLHPGQYKLTAVQFTKGATRTSLGWAIVEIGEKDVHNIRVAASPLISISGETAWDGEPPDQPVDGKLSVFIQPLARILFQGENLDGVTVAIPGDFVLPNVIADSYSVRVSRAPAGTYVKDVLYGGESILHAPMQVGKTMGTTMRIVVARDGGKIAVSVKDKNGQPVPDYQMALLPDGLFTEAAISDAMIVAQTDQYGNYTTGLISPGKYFAVGSDTSIDQTPECLKALLLARANAPAVNLSPNGQAQVALQVERTQ